MKIENPKFNASRELVAFDGLTLDSRNQVIDNDDNKAILKKMRELPRKEVYTGKTAPTVKVGDKEYRLSYKFYTDEEKKTYQEYRKQHSGTGTSTKKVVDADLLNHCKVIVTLKGVPEETKKWAQGIIDASNEDQKKKLDAALKAMIAAGIPEAQAKGALGL